MIPVVPHNVQLQGYILKLTSVEVVAEYLGPQRAKPTLYPVPHAEGGMFPP